MTIASTVHNWGCLDLPPTPNTRLTISLGRVATGILPAFACYYLTAVLVCLPNTRILRTALLPVSLLLAWRAATQYDVSAGIDEQGHLNYGLCVIMFGISMRNIEWAFTRQPLTLEGPSHKQNPLRDALDLFFNLRGVGWSWSKGAHLRRDYIKTPDTTFMITTFLNGLKDLIAFDTVHYIVQMISPDTFGSTGGTIYDTSLPPLQRYARSTSISLLSGLVVFLALEAAYSIATAIAFCIPGAHRQPPLWPPLTDRPWCSTSLVEFWGKRWHQSFRQPFIQLGAKPLAYVFGRAGGAIGVSLLSEVLHDLNMWGLGRGIEWPGFFVAMGVGIVLEGLWEKVTGKRVGGRAGWLWTMAWVAGWSNRLIEAWLKRGLAGKEIIPQHLRPGKLLVNTLLGIA